jgi:hypothetical protein
VLLLAALCAGPAAAGPKVTVYPRDLGFVRETRSLDIGGARDTVRIEDVPARLDFTSVRLDPAGDTKVVRLAWRYDVASGDALIEHALGRRVRITSRGDRATEGMLVSADGSWLVVRADDGTLNSVARPALEIVRLSNPAGDMALRPALEAVLEGGKRGKLQADLSYLTGGSRGARSTCACARASRLRRGRRTSRCRTRPGATSTTPRSSWWRASRGASRRCRCRWSRHSIG